MKNICFLIGNLNSSGGTERVTTLIANELSKKEEYKISILSLIDGLNPFFSLDSNISIYSLCGKKNSFKKNLFKVIWEIRQFVSSQHIDTLIVVDSISCVFTIPALVGLKINHICWEHFHFKNDNGVKYRDWGRKLATRYCNHIVVLTHKDLEFWERGVKKVKANLVCIPNPTPYINTFNEPSLDYKIVISVGRLTRVKGYDLLIEAWKKVCDLNSEWKLYIVGSGEEKQSLEILATQLGIRDRIKFTGQTNDVRSFYQKSSIFCLSSRNEGLPMVLLEAQAYGLPIVAFDCDTGPSEIVVNKKNGFLVPNGNIDSLASHLNEVINFEEKKYKKMVFESFLSTENFKIEKILDKWSVIL
ncbi:glycosyltransferase family 4 protein [Acinetobacter sp. BY484]|uniref:glycosyltransferase family 4 protein n=1 Tax=Acinetobacter sp. BY484 TaxID=2820674 RepID=UPI001C24311F|nr:glycosyltransferase family 4 protein [Acinetobacter sp. BY484]